MLTVNWIFLLVSPHQKPKMYSKPKTPSKWIQRMCTVAMIWTPRESWPKGQWQILFMVAKDVRRRKWQCYEDSSIDWHGRLRGINGIRIPHGLENRVAFSWTEDLFKIKEDSPSLSKEKAETYHTFVAKGFACKSKIEWCSKHFVQTSLDPFGLVTVTKFIGIPIGDEHYFFMIMFLNVLLTAVAYYYGTIWFLELNYVNKTRHVNKPRHVNKQNPIIVNNKPR